MSDEQTPRRGGVRFIPPPPDVLPTIAEQIRTAGESIGDANVALVGVLDGKGGWNSALILKGVHGWGVATWIGKDWGRDATLDYGVRVMKTWKLKPHGSD